MTTAKRDTSARHIRRTRNEVYADFVDAGSEVLQAGVPGQPTAVLEARLQVLNRHWDAFYDEHTLLSETIMTEDAQAVQDDLMLSVEKTYVEAVAELTRQLDMGRSTGSQRGSVTQEQQPIQQNITVNQLPNVLDDIKLERVHMEKFDGDYTKWLKFRDTFKALVHDKKNVSEAVKLYHLLDNLQPGVKKTLDGYSMSAESYAGAWETLLERYDNEWIIVESHLRKFMSLQKMTKGIASELHQLIDTTTGMLRSLPALGIQVDQWDPFVVFWLTTSKLDARSKEEWDRGITHKEIPTVAKLLTFMRQRARQLEVDPLTHGMASMTVNAGRRQSTQPSTSRARVMAVTTEQCGVCKQSHEIPDCPKFTALPAKVRFGKAKFLNLCFRCLKKGCRPEKCTAVACSLCGRAHHLLLCFSETPKPGEAIVAQLMVHQADSGAAALDIAREQEHVGATAVVGAVASQRVTVPTSIEQEKSITLFGTVQMRAPTNPTEMLRALIDTGAEVSLITERAVQRLSLHRQRASLTLVGLEGMGSTKSTGIVDIIAMPRFDSVERVPLRFYIVRKLTRCVPSEAIDLSRWSHFNQLQLADAECCQPGDIDVIVGVDQWNRLERREMHYSVDGSPAAQLTRLGWMVYGPVEATKTARVHRVEVLQAPVGDLNQMLERFWLSEETPSEFTRNAVEQRVEDHFVSTVTRNSDGAYCVNVPFNEKLSQLGASRNAALQQLVRNEKRMELNPSMRAAYLKFMKEYEELGHMTLQPDIERNQPQYFVPHHAVVSASKFRVVFNASFPSSTGVSLNDAQLVGEKLQDDLPVLIWRFRAYRTALTGDVTKMYRMVLVDPSQRDYQRVLWRENANERVREYTLNTVTYGTAAAPHLAVRALQQCAKDSAEQYPLGAAMAQRNFYVDDFLGGADTPEETLEVHRQVNAMLAKGAFVMSKWCSNSLRVSAAIGEVNATQEHPLGFSELETSVLGVRWQPCGDVFTFNVGRVLQVTKKTKRAIIGQIGRFYDPHGFAGPVTILAKIIIQEIWRAKVDWDQLVPEHIADAWEQFIQTLPEMESVNIPRWIGMSKSCSEMEIHGFSDASAKAFAAAVYVRCIQADGSISVSLLASKTKVAPLKTVTIARLELCGALLLARLVSAVREAFSEHQLAVYCWCDSEIVLHWLHRPSSDAMVFVANRVNEIQITTMEKGAQWRYVSTKVNPADLASRGCMPSVLASSTAWWSGPDYLRQAEEKWPEQTWRAQPPPLDVMELRPPVRIIAAVVVSRGDIRKGEHHILDCYSDWNKLVNVIGWMCRLFDNARARKRKVERTRGDLTAEEKAAARLHVYRLAQQQTFAAEIASCQATGKVSKTSALFRLNPFLDQEGILRLNGRLMNAPIHYDAKFPIVLSDKGHVTRLLMQEAHQETKHGGVQQILQYLRQEFWILRSRNLASSTVHHCAGCVKYVRTTESQVMGCLPELRVTPARAFERVGIDYCGPFLIKAYSGRCKIISKAYVAVFVCLVTRAVHLELVTDMTTDAFMAAYRRFVSRRGRCRFVLSDNGTTFVGAKSTQEKIRNVLAQLEESGETRNDFARWYFITPSAPHQGGIWEAAVKSFKRHLVRCIGDSQLTYEEFTTLLCQIEACLNSRPIARLSDDPNDLVSLTPGHFLIGEPLITPPQENIQAVPTNRLCRWSMVQKYHQHIWKRWQQEYLHTLLNRPKWTKTNRNIEVGDLVVVKVDNLPPSKWSMGRVQETFPGPDGVVRNVAVKQQNGIYRRPIQKLILLPLHELPAADEAQQ